MHKTFDRRSVLGIAVGSAAGAVMLASAKPSYAGAMDFKADLKGSSEVPPNQTTGTGTVTASFDPATKMLTWSGTFSGLVPAPPRPRTFTARPKPERMPA